MNKGVILFQSKYGSTKKYATWLSDATGFDSIETKKASISDISQYDTIILGGGVYASGIAGLSFLKKNIKLLTDKKIAVFIVGASPYDEKAFHTVCEHNFKGFPKPVKSFYCRGAWDEDAMTLKDRTLCKMLQKAIAKKDPSTYEPWMSALMSSIGEKCDWTDSKYLTPLLDYIN